MSAVISAERVEDVGPMWRICDIRHHTLCGMGYMRWVVWKGSGMGAARHENDGDGGEKRSVVMGDIDCSGGSVPSSCCFFSVIRFVRSKYYKASIFGRETQLVVR